MPRALTSTRSVVVAVAGSRPFRRAESAAALVVGRARVGAALPVSPAGSVARAVGIARRLATLTDRVAVTALAREPVRALVARGARVVDPEGPARRHRGSRRHDRG